MLWAAPAYSLGIIAGVYLWRPALWWTIAITAFVAAQPTSRGADRVWAGFSL